MKGSPGSNALSNPFPGLRPFEANEEHLFFGREKEVDELLRRLRTTRFLLVVGSSGTGKSSLVRSGLLPALESGFMLGAGSSWRTIIFRPGDNPLGNLAAAMDAPDALGTDSELASTNRVLLEATLNRSSLGIVQAVRQARIPTEDNVLLVVDQFEELFRFRRSGRNSRDEAVAFFKLLLEATRQQDVPVYVALTMRSDFLGDCIEFQGLPEVVNDGLYLIPRLTRDELRSAITGPVAVAGGEITQRLVLRLLNDLGDEQDQLPVLQHALMRTWDCWQTHRAEEPSIDIAYYEAIGGLQNALSLHAEEAFEEAGSVVLGQKIAERAFKALTDTYSDPRGVRRATSIQDLAAGCECPEADVMEVVEIFRRRGRSFLTPQASVSLESRTIVDLSHESLMRCWTRLVGWTREERDSARTYMRIAHAASWWSEGSGNLWSDPQLETALQWRQKNHPTAAWAERYDSHFALAMEFLDLSSERREGERKKEIRRRRTQRRFIYALSVLVVAAAALAAALYHQNAVAAGNANQAKQSAQLADTYFSLATKAVGEFLSSAGAHQSQEFSDSPDLDEFRGQLLDKAKTYYQQLASQKQGDEKVEAEMAMAHSNIGDVDRLRGMYQDAVNEYGQAIAQFEKLSEQHPRTQDYRKALAYDYMWLGETLRGWLKSPKKPLRYTAADGQNEYNQAIAIQQQLQQSAPKNPVYQQELARSYYSRAAMLDDSGGDALPDLQRALTLLTPLASGSQPEGEPAPAQELARVQYNLGVLYEHQAEHSEFVGYKESIAKYRDAILSLAQLRQKDPRNREYRIDAVTYSVQLASVLYCDNQAAEAKKATATAQALVDELTKPDPTITGLRTMVKQMEQSLAKP